MPPDPSRILDIACRFYDSAVLFCSLELSVFEILSGSDGKTAEDIAAENNFAPRCCRLLLDACVAAGLLEKHGDRYRNTPESEAFLVPGTPGDLGGAIQYNHDVYPAWGKLANLVRSGHPVEKPALHLGDDPKRTRNFVTAMHRRCMAIGSAVVPLLELEGTTRLLDVGGGPGTYSSLIARRHPDIHCFVMDLPPIVSIAGDIVRRDGMEDRLSFIGGDYRETAFPDALDAVLFFGVLHQESPESIQKLLAKAYDAMQPGGVIYILDMMTDETRAHPRFSAMFAVNMALTTESGWVFSEGDMRGWLGDTGFSAIALTMLPAPMPHWLISATKPA